MQRALPLLFLAVAACSKVNNPPQANTVADSAAMARAHTGVLAMDPEVRLAASLTLGIRSHPQFKDSMLAAYHVTQAQFDSLKAKIAADSGKNAAYQRMISQ